MDKVDFLGEIYPIKMVGASNQFVLSDHLRDNRQWGKTTLFDPRWLIIDNIPFDIIDLKTLVAGLKIEYLSLDYHLPSLTRIPQSKLEILTDRRESTIAKQVKTVDFKREFNSLTEYAIEIQLERYTALKPVNQFSGLKYYGWKKLLIDNDYNNEAVINDLPDRGTNYLASESGAWVSNTEIFAGVENYPINEYLYNGGLPGYLDLMPYLTKNGNLIFNDFNSRIVFKTDLLKTGNGNDKMIVSGGYSGYAYYQERPKKIIHDQSIGINAPAIATEILPARDKRALIYLTNNTNKILYFSFFGGVALGTNMLSCPYINPKGSLVWEHGDIINLDGETGSLKCFDKRATLGLPLFVKSESGAVGTVSCEQYVYNY